MQKKIFSAEIKQFSNGNQPATTAVEGGVGEHHYEQIMAEIKALRKQLGVEEEVEEEAPVEEGSMEIMEFVNLRQELQQLSEVIMETKREIASLQSSASGQKLNAMSDQLDAVVIDTETATNSILEAVEIIENKNESLEVNSSTPEEAEIVEGINGAIMKIYEACNFQDITGQRITKVVGTLAFVEERVGAMIDILGGEGELEEVEIVKQDVQLDDDIELNGPRPEGHEISQDEIDSLFD
ncbi:protein phosphatase CheZ [Sneathiella marina]|uniref:Protein phosphatase CheZ n=1 Tax=Sneathiella marina TaxID=2950108 RepID=A0ABY4W5Q4_9PROT|nr:protein phosphatase CheZ [Sneathiella marina]USG62176.1 protein phosphatase CheZ [Sneathiella marina]